MVQKQIKLSNKDHLWINKESKRLTDKGKGRYSPRVVFSLMREAYVAITKGVTRGR